MAKRYTGSCYIGVAGSEIGVHQAQRSILRMRFRDGDDFVHFHEHTKGQDARQQHIEKFLASKHDFIYLVDGDMLMPIEALEMQRRHQLACVSGIAFRRTYSPGVLPAWYMDDPEFRWPMIPFHETPEPGRLYKLGATGFFAWLIHREVIEAVTPLLKGEPFVWEDDMDVWPYDLAAVLRGEESLRVLRGTKDRVGADLRLSYFIRRAGYTIWGDPAVDCGHYTAYPLGLADWMGYSEETRREFSENTMRDLARYRDQHDAIIAGLKALEKSTQNGVRA